MKVENDKKTLIIFSQFVILEIFVVIHNQNSIKFYDK